MRPGSFAPVESFAALCLSCGWSTTRPTYGYAASALLAHSWTAHRTAAERRSESTDMRRRAHERRSDLLVSEAA